MTMTATATRHFGKYRGTVINNIDPMMRGRLLVEAPDALGLTPSSWAEACVPLAGPTGPPMGTWFVPPIGAGVWVEFERGDPSRPIWSGCRWGTPADPPTLALNGLPASPSIVLQTAGQNAIAISDLPGPTGGIMLKSTTGATLIVNDTGIFIQNGKGASIVMTGPTVTVNAGALTVI
ncbi:phage baseplate assembly protein V [Nocardioides sp. cx-173]|uniref:phage baseplate assembly protein V n=1 Tax=Nocardioides sp. cx-173 TaxID=2898796 RepID=UPI001E5F1E9C|nr:phage baseplate assembly protein V [Nocardioides sp. cx-173]MCD4525969.1 phage baseplate assembly protein V [Nocardioides sp. cx-173]UGB43666.1 phage baseplate assembly protein V [Nocardioides sp. cx-173]